MDESYQSVESSCPCCLGSATGGRRQTEKYCQTHIVQKDSNPIKVAICINYATHMMRTTTNKVFSCFSVSSKSIKSNHPIRIPFGLDACSPFSPGCVSSTLTGYHPWGRIDNTKEALIRFLCLSSR